MGKARWDSLMSYKIKCLSRDRGSSLEEDCSGKAFWERKQSAEGAVGGGVICVTTGKTCVLRRAD